ncbi:MAG: STAS domain-containing protein [Christensenellaceae bacterium]|jgi:stage II sporulation protein AA (anti-sigma F factor antagonist)|nr:STAS domain-containing protein [Christensenellaceae bacterium]
MKFELIRGSLIIRLAGDLDHARAGLWRKTLDKVLSLGGFERVFFDFSKTTFIDSTGVGLILGRYKLLKSLNKPLFILSPPDSVDKVLKVSGIYTIINKVNEVI